MNSAVFELVKLTVAGTVLGFAIVNACVADDAPTVVEGKVAGGVELASGVGCGAENGEVELLVENVTVGFLTMAPIVVLKVPAPAPFVLNPVAIPLYSSPWSRLVRFWKKSTEMPDWFANDEVRLPAMVVVPLM